jgi:hypothetical protein
MYSTQFNKGKQQHNATHFLRNSNGHLRNPSRLISSELLPIFSTAQHFRSSLHVQTRSVSPSFAAGSAELVGRVWGNLLRGADAGWAILAEACMRRGVGEGVCLRWMNGEVAKSNAKSRAG